MKRFQNMICFSGIFADFSYLIFTAAAYFCMRDAYSPLKNWLSDLGNADLNPQGAIFYNTGIITTAVFMIAFFINFSIWRIEKKRIQIIMVHLTRIFGILGAYCMIMSAIFPINILEVHRFWSIALYIMLATAFVFSAAALRYHENISRWLFALGISTAVIVNLTNFFPTVCFLEWIAVLLFLAYVGLVSVVASRKQEIAIFNRRNQYNKI